MISEIEQSITEYSQWLRDRTEVRAITGTDWAEITTPLLNHNNDHLQIYVRRQDNGFLLTDGGDTLTEVEMAGVNVGLPRRRDRIRSILNGFGVRQDDNGALEIHATSRDLPERKHQLLQAMLAVDGLYVLSASSVMSLFQEDVATWFDFFEIRYVPDVAFTGKTGLTQRFDYAIPKSHHAPERLIEAISRPNRSTMENFIFKWTDVQETRPQESTAYAILNDEGTPVNPSILDGFRAYDIQPILWTNRDEVRDALAA
jgi:hypothetical protein